MYHGTTATCADSILERGIDLNWRRVRDPGDFGWGFYLTGQHQRARQHGQVVLAARIELTEFAHVSNPYFLDGLDPVEPQSDVEKLFHSIAFDGEQMLTVNGRPDQRVHVAKAVRDAFLAEGYAGIATPYDGWEVVVFDPTRIRTIQRY